MFYAAENAHVRQLVEQALFHADHVVGDLPDHDDEEATAGPRRSGRGS
jgi:hypothetical protein